MRRQGTATQALKRMKWLFQLKNNWIDIAIDKKVDPFPYLVGLISTNAFLHLHYQSSNITSEKR